jgi:hypothetical protein
MFHKILIFVHLLSLGLGRNGAYSLLASWNEDLDRIVNKELPPLPVEARRNTVALGELKGLPALPAPLIVTEDEGSLRPASLMTPSMANTSLNTLLAEVNCGSILPPSSAASTATLFELDDSFGPEAHSTPQHKATHKNDSTPLSAHHTRNIKDIKNERRSSIIYIKSDDSSAAFFKIGDEDDDENNNNNYPKKTTHSRSKLQHKSSSSPRRGPGLRPLSLLQQQQEQGTTRPLLLSKKSLRSNASSDAENVAPTTNLQMRMKTKNLKPLQLARSETTKQRGLLRKNEVLPEVVVRPPSQGEGIQSRVLYDRGFSTAGFR